MFHCYKLCYKEDSYPDAYFRLLRGFIWLIAEPILMFELYLQT